MITPSTTINSNYFSFLTEYGTVRGDLKYDQKTTAAGQIEPGNCLTNSQPRRKVYRELFSRVVGGAVVITMMGGTHRRWRKVVHQLGFNEAE
jgi:hypothetical protein